MNDRSFTREHTRRSLQAIIDLMDEATKAESVGDFLGMEEKDKVAAIGLSLTAGNVLHEVTPEDGAPPRNPGYVAEVLKEQIDQLKDIK